MVTKKYHKGRAALLASIPLPDYRDVRFFEWQHADESTGKNYIHEGVCFVPTDLASVTIVREYFEKKCTAFALGETQTFEITLICDELLTNGIIATYNRGRSEYLVLRYKISADYAILSVLDYGGGFNLPEVQKELPEGETLSDFLADLNRYRSQNQRKVPVCGKVMDHNRFGRGLRIVTGLVDALVILFHNEEGKLTRTIDNKTLGTVISVRYNLKTRNS